MARVDILSKSSVIRRFLTMFLIPIQRQSKTIDVINTRIDYLMNYLIVLTVLTVSFFYDKELITIGLKPGFTYLFYITVGLVISFLGKPILAKFLLNFGNIFLLFYMSSYFGKDSLFYLFLISWTVIAIFQYPYDRTMAFTFSFLSVILLIFLFLTDFRAFQNHNITENHEMVLGWTNIFLVTILNVVAADRHRSLLMYKTKRLIEFKERAVQSERNLIKLFQNTPLAMAWDIEGEGRLSKANKQFSEMLGYTSEELSQLTSNDITHPEDRGIHHEEYERLKADEIEGFNLEKRYLCKDGSIIWAKVYLSAVHDDNGDFVHEIIMIENISDRKRAERKLELEKMRLSTSLKDQVKLNKLLGNTTQQLQEFTHIASHNLRAPVGNIQSLLNLYDEEKEFEYKDGLMKHVRTSTNNLMRTIQELDQVIQINDNQDIQKEMLFFDDMLNTVCESISELIKESGIIIRSEFTRAPSLYYARPYLESILLNLLTNSIKYRSSERQAEVRFETRLINTKVVLTCTDNGLGLDMEKFGHKLFGLRKTFHRNEDARGLGLFLTKAQITSLGGTIKFESEVNKGSRLTVNF